MSVFAFLRVVRLTCAEDQLRLLTLLWGRCEGTDVLQLPLVYSGKEKEYSVSQVTEPFLTPLIQTVKGQ